ncbi:MAG: right-handed parallel beta-helix repeat-containing protein [Planctomycetes bacterium]|nr:right-handed parallel beta-helix repeat-containing protein [Planctomycetota bacterium]
MNTEPTGNHDALKVSGVDHFLVRNCRFEGWGGSGIDMVGCHHGVVEDCTFVGRAGFSQSNAVQLKGTTEDILVQCCHFEHVGHRSINLGGSTGLPYFRPRVPNYEAKHITVAGNVFVGSMAPIAWVTAHGGHVHHNTIVLPENWVLRILQESSDTRFTPCHSGVFEHNLIIFDATVQTFVNVGPRTAPDTFSFRHNAWFGVDGYRKPSLPVPEINGLYLRALPLDETGLPLPGFEDEHLEGIGARAYARPHK